MANASQLIYGDGVYVHVINGEKSPRATLAGGAPRIELVEGTNQVLVTYTAVLKNKREDVVTSDTYLLNFVAGSADIVISAPRVRKERDMEKFNLEGSWIVTSANGEKVAYQKARITKSGLQLARDLVREVEDYNYGDGELALPQLYVDKIVSRRNRNNSSTLGAGEGLAADVILDGNSLATANLRYWFNVATDSEKAEFYKWLATQ